MKGLFQEQVNKQKSRERAMRGRAIGDIVMGRIQHLDGVLTTVTLFSIG